MKLYQVYTIFVTFGIFCEVKTVSQVVSSRDLQNAFVDISRFVSKRDHLVSVVMIGNVLSKPSTAAIFRSASALPHEVLFSNESFELNNSAIATFSSLENLIIFNKITDISENFLASRQIFIHIEGLTYDEILTLT